MRLRLFNSHRVGLLLAGLSALALFSTRAVAADNWPSWRGPQDDGCAQAGNYPVKWDAEKVVWKTPLPGKGCSTPVVWDRRIYLTAPANGRDAALAFDWEGKQLWQTTFGTEIAGKHRNGSGCNPSPATDGKAVFVYFKSGSFAALELDAKVRWRTNLVETFGQDNLYWDYGTSPVLTEKYVVMARMHHGDSWLAAFDKTTGHLIWKVARNYETPVEDDHSYGTPVVLKWLGQETLLIWGAQRLTLHSASDGKPIWESDGDFNPNSTPNWPTVASPVVVGSVAVVASARADRGQPRLDGIAMGGPTSASYRASDGVRGDASAPRGGRRLWVRHDIGTYVPTPAIYHGKVLILSDRGAVECLDPVIGKTVWSGVLPKSSSNFYASPVIAGDKLYAIREDGVVFVVALEGGFSVLAENKMGEHIIASPAAVSGRLLIRGEQHLFSVGGN